MSRIKDLAVEIGAAQQYECQNKYIKWVAEEEGCDWSEALAICQGRTDPKEIGYIVGFKMSIPAFQKAMSNPATRAAAIAAFEDSLPVDELEYFRSECLPEFDDGHKFRSELKKAKKKQKF